MNYRKATTIALLAGITGLCAPAQAAPPPVSFTYQGSLAQSGVAVDGATPIQFRLWDAASGGSQLGSTIDRISDVDAGIFTESLDFGLSSFAVNQALWLEVIVDGQSMGRTSLTAAPYSLNTRGLSVDQFGRVGIGTVDPSSLLHVQGGVNDSSTVVRLGSDTGSVKANFSVGNFEIWEAIASSDEFRISKNGNASPIIMKADGSLTLLGSTSSSTNIGFFDDVFMRNSVLMGFLGNVGIGTTNPFDKLHVAGSIRVDDGMRIGTIGYSNVALTIDRPLDFGIVLAQGDAGKPGGGSWANTSDIRLKKNIAPIEGALDTLLELRGVHFEYKDPKSVGELEGVRTGFIAQEVEKVIADWVWDAQDGYKRVTIRGFEAMAVEAMRELQTENDDLRERIESLEAMVSTLIQIEN